jgi:hypothetical protein
VKVYDPLRPDPFDCGFKEGRHHNTPILLLLGLSRNAGTVRKQEEVKYDRGRLDLFRSRAAAYPARQQSHPTSPLGWGQQIMALKRC